MMATYPEWLGSLSRKDELLRAHHGLYASPDGWYKSFRGKKRYICRRLPLADVVALLPHRLQELDGQISKPLSLAVSSLTIEQLAEIYAAHLQRRHDTGSPRPITARTMSEHLDVLARFVAPVQHQLAINVRPEWFTHFARSISQLAASSRNRQIGYLFAFLNWAGPGKHSFNFYKQPVPVGPELRKPSAHEMRTALANYNPAYSPAEYGDALNAVACCPVLFAAGLLALNAALLPIDLVTLPRAAVDLHAGTLRFPRGKNGNARRAVLMPETIAAVSRYLDFRPAVRDDQEPLFVDGNRRVFGVAGEANNRLSRAWSLITGKRLVGLRSTFATYADSQPDQGAIDVIMGHTPRTIRSQHYVKEFGDDRLRKVIEPVWKPFSVCAQLQPIASIDAAKLARLVTEKREVKP